MKKEWKIFLTAIMYFTRIRVPRIVDHSPEYLQKAPRYFPLVGIIVGAICSLLFLVFARYVSTDSGILASMIAGLLVTGAFHEDGFADACDGFGGGWTKEKILGIMKDSRIGAFGAIGLIAILGSKFLLLREMHRFVPDIMICPLVFNQRRYLACLIAAHSLSRLMPVLVMQFTPYTADPDQSKSKPLTTRKLNPAELGAAILFALIPFVFLSWHFLLAILPVLYATYELRQYFKKWIGGYTGDCMGAIQQVSEIVLYLGFIIVWKYI
ncbi:MAG TPA: adenosylcobinamide-GDP ribazoletransferase [Puia sp.]|nr:adenosylcobinamide-GDP ribazoletransferase [Puia sp.]